MSCGRLSRAFDAWRARFDAAHKGVSAIFVQPLSHWKRIETAGSLIEQMLPKSIHAVTPQGFELKVALFVVAYSLNCYIDL